MKILLTLISLLPIQAHAIDNVIRDATVEEVTEIEKNMDQMKFQFDPSTVKLKKVLITDQTFCGRMDATRKNGTKATDLTIYGTWFGGEAVAPIATGAGARRMCDLDKFPKN